MNCPYCDSSLTVVLFEDRKKKKVFRERGCNHCSRKWKTVEKVMHFRGILNV